MRPPCGRAHLGDERGHGRVGLLALGGLALEPADRLVVLLAGGAAVTILFQELEEIRELLHLAGRLSRPFEMDRQHAQRPRRLDVFESLGHEGGWMEGSPGCRRSKAARKMAGSGFGHRPRWTGSLASPAVGKRRPGRLLAGSGDTPVEAAPPPTGSAASSSPTPDREDGRPARRNIHPAIGAEQCGARQRPVGLLVQQGVAQVEQDLGSPPSAPGHGSPRPPLRGFRISSKRNPARRFLRLGLGRMPRRTNTSRMTSTLRPLLSC